MSSLRSLPKQRIQKPVPFSDLFEALEPRKLLANLWFYEVERTVTDNDIDGKGSVFQLQWDVDTDEGQWANYYVKVYEDDVSSDDYLVTSPTWSTYGTDIDWHSIAIQVDHEVLPGDELDPPWIELKLEVYDASNNQLKQTWTADQDEALSSFRIESGFDDSTSISINGTGDGSASGTINYDGDVDMFRFVAAASGTATVQLDPSGSLDPILWVYNSSKGTIINGKDDGGSGTTESASFNVTGGQTYYIKSDGWSDSTGGYTVIVDGPGVPDDYPGNNFPGTQITINPVSGDGSISGTINYGGDEDMFRFIAAGSGTAVVQIDPSGNLDPVLWVYNSNYGVIINGKDDGGSGTTESASFNVTGGQTYYVKADGWSDSTGGYTVIVNGPPGPPTEWELACTPDPAWKGQTLTMTATNISSPNGISKVAMFLDWNANQQYDSAIDLLLGPATYQGGTTWRLQKIVGAMWGSGPTTIGALVYNGQGQYIGDVYDTLTINGNPPRIVSMTGSPDTVYWNQQLTLTAKVQDDGGVSKVTFFFDRDGNGKWTQGGNDVALGPGTYIGSGLWRRIVTVNPAWGTGVKNFCSQAWDNNNAWSPRVMRDTVVVQPNGRPDNDDRFDASASAVAAPPQALTPHDLWGESGIPGDPPVAWRSAAADDKALVSLDFLRVKKSLGLDNNHFDLWNLKAGDLGGRLAV